MYNTDMDWAVEGSALGAAPARAVQHPNAGLLDPLWRGSACDGLSGLYAAINGVRLAIAHKHVMTGPETEQLIRSALRFLDGRISLQQCLANGLRTQLWRRLVFAVCEAASQRLGVRVMAEELLVERLGSPSAAFSALEGALLRWRLPLVLRRGGLYTVVTAVTPKSLVFHDSGGACWISKRLCSVPGDQTLLRHAIYPSSFMALSV